MPKASEREPIPRESLYPTNATAEERREFSAIVDAYRESERAEAERAAERAICEHLVGRFAIYFPLGEDQLDVWAAILDRPEDVPAQALEVGLEHTEQHTVFESAGNRLVNEAESAGRIWRSDHALSGRHDDDAPLVLFLEISAATTQLLDPAHLARFPGLVVFDAGVGLPTIELARRFDAVGLNLDDFEITTPAGEWTAAMCEAMTGTGPIWETAEPTTELMTEDHMPDTAGPDSGRAVADEIDPEDRRAINFVDWRAEMTDGPRPIDWLVPQILERGLLYQLVGAPKSGKSMLILWLLWRLVTGQDPMPGTVAAEADVTLSKPIRVLVVDKENSPRILADRLQEFGADPETLDGLHYASFPAFAPLDTSRGAAQLLALARHLDVDLVVLDTVSRFVSGNENDSQTYLDLYRHLLAPLKSDGRTVVRIDHTGKDPALGARGSSAKGGDVDVSWILTKGQTASRLKLVREYDRTNDHPECIHIRRAQGPLRHEAVPGRITVSELADDERADIDRLTEAQRELVSELEALGVPETDGRDKVRARLKEAGSRATNVDLSAAIGHRRARRGLGPAESDSRE